MDQSEARAMVATMARMQESYNREVHADWRNQGFQFYRAIWVECAELLDHFGWKWWKHQQPDLEQVKLEIVDIWHFGLSDMLRAGTLNDRVGDRLLNVPRQLDDGRADERLRKSVEHLAVETLKAESFMLEPFIAVLETLPMDLEELFRLYVGKNVLNGFRLANGYKTGTYVKQWDSREDNEHLVELLEALSIPPDAIPDALFAALTERYGALTGR